MLNKFTREILVQLGQINQSQIITYPVTVVKMGMSIQAFLDVSKDTEKGCKEEKFEEFGVYVINELNSVINVIDNPEINIDKGLLTIKNDLNSVKYYTTALDILESESRGNPEVIDNVQNEDRNQKVLSFDLDSKSLEKIKKMSGLLRNLSDLEVKTVGDKISLTVKGKEKSTNNFELNITGESGASSEDINMLILMDSVNKLPNSGYKVTIYRSSKGSLISVFSSLNVDGLNILIAGKA